MCYFLVLASPLTLSEVRSMLPPGLAADPLSPQVAQAYRRLEPSVATAALLLSGACSCDLLLARDPEGGEDERHLRRRYRDLGASRSATIAALERHRRGVHPPAGTERTGALAGFVAEHARNAGPTLYHLQFGLQPVATPPATLIRRPVAAVLAAPSTWLVEGNAILATLTA